MPFYEYECSACKFYVEALQKISDPPLRKCPNCSKQTLKKLISAPVFRLKGDGWYETDFKSDKEDKRNLADREEASESKGSESKSDEGDSSAKPSVSKPAKPAPEPQRVAAKAAPIASAKAAAGKAKAAAKARPAAKSKAKAKARPAARKPAAKAAKKKSRR